MRKSGSRVLAGLTSVAIGGVFVAASALGALADSPEPASISATVTPVAGGNLVSISGTLTWKGGCKSDAGYGIVWNDAQNPGLPLANAAGVPNTLVGLTNAPAGGTDTNDNLVHRTASCAIGPISHLYTGSLPSLVCAIGYHTSLNVATGFHSRFEGGAPGDTDNSVNDADNKNAQIEAPTVANGACTNLVVPKSDVELKESGAPNPVNPGDSVTWTVNVDNLPNVASTTMTQHLKVNVDNNQTITSFSAPGWTNCAKTASQVTCDYTPLLAPGGKAPDVTVTATVLDNGESSVGSTAHVDNGNNSDDANVNNQDGSASVNVNPDQNIKIDKTATPQVQVGETIEYTMVVTNKSAAPTTAPVKVTDLIPGTVTFQNTTGTDSKWSCNDQQNLSCDWNGGPLAAGAKTTAIVVHATALQTAVPSVTNTAHAIEGNIDVQDSATTIVNTPVNLILTKSADPASGSDVLRGQTIHYTLHYANTGTTAANGVVIKDPIPTGTKFAGNAICTTTCTVGGNDSEVTFTLDLAANESGDASFDVTVNSDDVDNQVITNQANLSYNGSVIFSNQTHHQVHVPSGDLVITKAVSYTKPATVNSVLTYTLTATASGNIDQTNVVVTDAVPDGTTFKSGTTDCSANGCSSPTGPDSQGVLSWSVGTMHPGDTVTMHFGVTVNGADAAGTIPTEIDNIADIQSDQTPLTPSNRVVVPLSTTTVLGTKIVKVPTATTLPFTGLNSLQDALLAAVLIGGGMLLLTWPRLQRRQTGTV